VTPFHTVLVCSPPRPWLYAVGVLVLLAAGPARGQAPEVDGWDTGRWRFGPLAVTPTVELKNLGWDSNVFNATEDAKSGFTTTVGAPIDWWLRFGRGRLHVVDYFEGVYFANYPDQSGFNQRHDVALLMPLRRLRPYVGGYYLSTNDRPGYEINARLRHAETGVNGGAVVHLSSRLDLDLSGRQTTYEYDDEDYAGNPYSTTLNHRTQAYGAQARYRVSSLTTLTLIADSLRERYTESPDRDNDGYRILPGVEFDPLALVKGKAQVGYRKLNAIAAGMPDFSGLVANVELSYVLLGTTRFAVGASRDVYVSYEIDEPFYVQPGFTLSVTQQMTGPWDVQARGGWYRLSYRQAAASDIASQPGRVDHYGVWGGGVGYRVGRDIRVGFNLDYVRRESVVPGQSYDGLRGGMAATYAFK